MKKNSCFCATSLFLTSSVFAGIIGPLEKNANWGWFHSISFGPVWETGGKTQFIDLTPEITKLYTMTNSNDAIFDGEVFLGIQRLLLQNIQGEFGVAAGFTGNTSLEGHILDDADSKFNNYIYSYKLQHTYVAVKAKLLADLGLVAMPWVSASLGVGFNDAHNFNSTPTLPDFASYTETSVTYTVGGGVQKLLNKHWQVGIGYEFADWGKSHLNRAPGQTLNTGLALNHLYTNGILFNATYTY